MKVEVKQLGIAKVIRVHTHANGDLECRHTNLIEETVEADLPSYSNSLYSQTVLVCEDCNQLIDHLEEC